MLTLRNTQVQHFVLAPASLMFSNEIVLFHPTEASSLHLRFSVGCQTAISCFLRNLGVTLGAPTVREDHPARVRQRC